MLPDLSSGLQLQTGDLVKIWRGSTHEIGILVKRKYFTYEDKYNKWEVSCGGEVFEIHEKYLSKISKENKL